MAEPGVIADMISNPWFIRKNLIQLKKRLTLNNMVTIKTVKVRNSPNYKNPSNT